MQLFICPYLIKRILIIYPLHHHLLCFNQHYSCGSSVFGGENQRLCSLPLLFSAGRRLLRTPRADARWHGGCSPIGASVKSTDESLRIHRIRRDKDWITIWWGAVAQKEWDKRYTLDILDDGRFTKVMKPMSQRWPTKADTFIGDVSSSLSWSRKKENKKTEKDMDN